MKRYGVIDMFPGVGGFTLAAQQRPDIDILYAVEAGTLESCLYQMRFPDIPLEVMVFEKHNIERLHTILKEVLQARQTTHITMLHMKSRMSFHNLSLEKPENNILFAKELAILNWIILECIWLRKAGLLHFWMIETEPKLYEALDYSVRWKLHAQEYNQIVFGIPQDKRFVVVSDVVIPLRLQHSETPALPGWGPILSMSPMAVMFAPRYEHVDIMKMVLAGRLNLMEVRMAHELAFELFVQQGIIVSTGVAEDDRLIPLSSSHIGLFYGFPPDYLDVELFVVHEKERRGLYILGKSPRVAAMLLNSVFPLVLEPLPHSHVNNI